MYYNRPNVRKALHVQPMQEEAGLWLGLNPRIATAYTYDITSVIPQHEFLISQGMAYIFWCTLASWYTSSICVGYSSDSINISVNLWGFARTVTDYTCLSKCQGWIIWV